MSQPAKFLFNTEFSTDAGAAHIAAAPREKIYWTTPERDAASAEAFAKGKQAGIAETQAQIEAQTAAALELIAQNVATVTSQVEDENARLKSEAVILANTIAKSLASALIQREPLHEIEALFDEAINFMPNNPHIAIRVDQAHLDLTKEKLGAIAENRGFVGKLIVTSDANVQSGDCRIEWTNGSILKDKAIVRQKIHTITAQYIHKSHEAISAELDDFDFATFLPSGQPDESAAPNISSIPKDTTPLPEDA